MFYSLVSFCCSFWFLLVVVEARLTLLPEGDSYTIYQWSQIPFPTNISISLIISDQSYLVTPTYFIPNPPGNAPKLIVNQYYDSGTKGSIPVGLLAISYSKFQERFGNQTNRSISAIFEKWDDNIFELSQSTYAMPYNCINLVADFICLFWAFWKIVGLARNNQFELQIAPVCLCLEVINSLLRMGSAISFLLRMQSDDQSLYSLSVGLLSFSFAFNLSSGIFIIYFWMNLLSKKMYKSNIMEKSFWPSFILVGIIWTLLFLFGIFYLVGLLSQTLINYTGGIILFLCLILAFFYFVTAYKVFNYTENRTGSDDFKKLAIKIVLSGVCFVLIVIFSILQISFFNQNQFKVYVTGGLILYLLFSLRSFLQIDVFGTMKKKNREVVINFSSPETQPTSPTHHSNE